MIDVVDGFMMMAERAFKQRDDLVKALEAISRATIEGRVCDDVAWFDEITTLHHFCEITLDRVLGRVSGAGGKEND